MRNIIATGHFCDLATNFENYTNQSPSTSGTKFLAISKACMCAVYSLFMLR